MRKKIVVFVSGRADFGQLKPLIQRLQKSQTNSITVIWLKVESFENSDELKEVQNCNIENVKLSVTDDAELDIKISRVIQEISGLFSVMKSDLLIILGDRYEAFAAAISASTRHIPIAHIHGGELTHGSLDDQWRHCITKMAKIHFVARPEYRSRVIQMGEQPSSIYTIGYLSHERLLSEDFYDKPLVESMLGCKVDRSSILITLHPNTTDYTQTKFEIDELLSALARLKDVTSFIFTMPNADPGNIVIRTAILGFCTKTHNAFSFESLGFRLYASTLRQAGIVLGNSSSGVTEAPYLGVRCINIGDRQDGRVLHPSIKAVPFCKDAIEAAVIESRGSFFEGPLMARTKTASELIASVIENVDFSELAKTKKAFFTLRSSVD